MIKVKLLAAVVVFCVFPSVSMSQERGQSEQPSVGESAVVIVNRGNMPLGFSMRPYNGQWDNYVLQPGNNIKIVCINCTTEGFDIALATGSQKVEYQLPSGDRFALEWNYGRSMWDVFRATQ